MPSSPYVTFTLKRTKSFQDKSIVWKETINEELLMNGNWYLKIKSVALTNIEYQEPSSDGNREYDHTALSLHCNLVKNNFQWFGKIIQHQTNYQEIYPIELFSTKKLNSKKLSELFIPLPQSTYHKINSMNRYIEIELKPLNSDYKFKDFQCHATVLVCLYQG